MKSDGSGLKQLTDDPLAVLMDGAWSPDGQRLTFNAMRKGGLRLGMRGLAWNEIETKKYSRSTRFRFISRSTSWMPMGRVRRG